MTVIVRGEITDQMTEPETYGTVSELYYFAGVIASSLCQQPNRVLKSSLPQGLIVWKGG